MKKHLKILITAVAIVAITVLACASYTICPFEELKKQDVDKITVWFVNDPVYELSEDEYEEALNALRDVCIYKFRIHPFEKYKGGSSVSFIFELKNGETYYIGAGSYSDSLFYINGRGYSVKDMSAAALDALHEQYLRKYLDFDWETFDRENNS